MTEEPDKRLRVELDHENKVIRLGCYYYDFKGVMICEATEEEKKKFLCGRFMTYPIVDDDWRVRDDDCVADGIERLIIGKKGDTIPLAALQDALDYNAEEHCCDYSDVLVDLERHGITISNRKSYDSEEELSDTVVISIDKIRKNEHMYRIDAHWGSYYIPRRFCYVGDDDELYQLCGCAVNGYKYPKQKIVDLIAEDVHALSWFFHKPNLKVFATSISKNFLGFRPNELSEIPKDWYYTVQTLDTDINKKLESLYKEYPEDYYKGKLPDIVRR